MPGRTVLGAHGSGQAGMCSIVSWLARRLCFVPSVITTYGYLAPFSVYSNTFPTNEPAIALASTALERVNGAVVKVGY